ncbi:MAG: hypothetical protein IPL35_16870 [Sphingobacteriales bacterium]|nr:hypothetical protein [Sphingobacteriales bacterium]
MQKLAEKQAWSVKPIKFPKESGRSKRGSSRGGSTSKTAIEYSTTDADALFPDQQQLIFKDRDNKLPQYVGYANDGAHFYIYDLHGNLVYSEETLSDWAQIPEAASLHFRERFPTAYTEATLFKISYGAKDAAKTQVFRLKAKGKNYYYAADGTPINIKKLPINPTKKANKEFLSFIKPISQSQHLIVEVLTLLFVLLPRILALNLQPLRRLVGHQNFPEIWAN